MNAEKGLFGFLLVLVLVGAFMVVNEFLKNYFDNVFMRLAYASPIVKAFFLPAFIGICAVILVLALWKWASG